MVIVLGLTFLNIIKKGVKGLHWGIRLLLNILYIYWRYILSIFPGQSLTFNIKHQNGFTTAAGGQCFQMMALQIPS